MRHAGVGKPKKGTIKNEPNNEPGDFIPGKHLYDTNNLLTFSASKVSEIS